MTDDVTHEAEKLAALIRADPAAARSEFLAHWRRLVDVSPDLVRELASDLFESSPAEDPLLTVAFASSSRHRGGGANAVPLLERLRGRIAADEGGKTSLMIEIDLELVAAYRGAGRLADALAVLDEVDRSLDHRLPLPERFRWSARTGHERALIAFHEGRFASAEHLVRQSPPPDAFSAAAHQEAKGVAAFIAWTRGAFPEVDAILAADPDERANGASSALAEAARCLVAVERGDLEAAVAAAKAAERAGQGTEWEGFVRYARATTAVLSGDSATALNELDRAERVVLDWQGTPVVPTLCAGMRAVMLLHMGHVEAAIEILNTLAPTENHSNCPGRFQAALALLRGDLDEAGRVLDTCLGLGVAHSERTLVDVLALASAIAYERGDEPTAELTFDRALRMAVANQMQATFYLLQFAVLDAMLARAAERPQPPGVLEYITDLRQTSSNRPFSFIEPLSEREREVALLAAEGGTIGAIAKGLWISANTTKAHLRSIYRKLGVSTRAQLRRRLRSIGVQGPDAKGSL
jgi:DNA-binding CsgD family transcriptional regulator/uncharacterized protein HemY